MTWYHVTGIDYDTQQPFAFYVDANTIDEALRKANVKMENGPPNAEITKIRKQGAA